MNIIDTWESTGNSFAEFEKRIDDIDSSTVEIDIDTSFLELLPVSGVIKKEDGNNKIEFKVYNREHSRRKNLAPSTELDMKLATDAGLRNELIDELLNRSKLAIRIDGKFYLTSKGLSRDLGARANLAGDALYDPTEERAAYLMSRYLATPSAAKAIIRNEKGTSACKIVALASKQYHYIPQSFLYETYRKFEEQLGKLKCDKWGISSTATYIYITCDEKARDIAETYGLKNMPTPGMLLETSDTGDCSITAHALWKTRRGYYIRGKSLSRRHQGYFTNDSLYNFFQSSLFSLYTKLPERFCELSLIDVSNPRDCIERVIKNLNSTKEMKALGKKRISDLRDALTGELDCSYKYTAYDIALMFFEISSRFNIESDSTLETDIQKIGYSAIFVDYKKIVDASSKPTFTPKI